MVEPTSIVLISAAVGGVAAKFVEKAWNSGEKWLSSYLKDHAPKAQERAQENALDFLAELAQRVKILEQRKEESKSSIEDSLGDPSFSTLLQKAIISSADTNDKQKHQLLARLVSHRLTTSSESMLALSSKLACDAISGLNTRQLRILGLLATLVAMRPGDFPPPNVPKQMLDSAFRDWLIERLKVYANLTFTEHDLLHLDSLSCVKWDSILSRDLKTILAGYSKRHGFDFHYAAFSATNIGSRIVKLWNNGLQQALPTTVGQLIGVYVSDMLCDSTTSIGGWWTKYD